jgi:hypothetical protein
MGIEISDINLSPSTKPIPIRFGGMMIIINFRLIRRIARSKSDSSSRGRKFVKRMSGDEHTIYRSAHISHEKGEMGAW